MAPAATPVRRTRKVAPATPANDSVEDVTLPPDESAVAEAATELASPTRVRRQGTQLRRVQAAVVDEKVRVPRAKRATETTEGISAPIKGRSFRLSEGIGLMPLMEWAASADEVDGTNSTRLASFFRVLRDLVHPDDWNAFRAYTREQKCSDADFIAFQNAAFEAIAARPTQEPAAS